MRKNKKDRTSVNYLKTTYKINGLNLDRFINTVKKRGVNLYDIKKIGNKTLIVSVKFSESEKFFAIAEEMCYNIKKVKESGVLYPFLQMWRSVGVIIGALLIFLSAIYFDGVIFSVNFAGSGAVYKRDVEKYLSNRGIGRFSRFADIDLKTLEDEILAFHPNLSFASCKKQGSVLKIDLAASQDKVEKLSGNVYELRSDVSGVIESIKVYRGTAICSVGQAVSAGDLLVDGVAIIKDQTVKINVLASVSIICQKVFVYNSTVGGQEEIAKTLANEAYPQILATESEVSVEQIENQFVYTVTLKYRKIICVG